MKLRSRIYALLVSMGISTLSFQVMADSKYIQIKQDQKVIADVIHIEHLEKLQLFLNDQHGRAYKKFAAIQRDRKNCKISFAMNAGMYHANYAPVGLYIEQGKVKNSLNTDTQKFGNFFMQPNGVVAWNKNKAMIVTTQQYAQAKLKMDFATQSGPMLVIDGKLNPSFLAGSDSLKIRNGVGIKNNQLYFVISRGKMNFYDFANIFKLHLAIDQGLYLDGSISSAFIPQAKRYDATYDLGPIFAYSESTDC